MKQINLIIMVLALCFTNAVKADNIPLPAEYQNYRWHKFDTNNFEILSIDYQQGLDIQANVEALKTWINHRWGLKDGPLSKKCMILCVPSQDIFTKWFHKNDLEPRVSKSADASGTTRDVYAIWITGQEGSLSNRLPEKVCDVCLLSYEDTYRVKVNYAIKTGMASLCNDIQSVRKLIGSLDPNASYSATSLSSVVQDANLPDIQFKAKCTAMCLLLRKQQYANQRFPGFLVVSDSFNQAVTVFGFRGLSELDPVFNKYLENLIFDIRNSQTPDIGLTWFVEKNN